MCPGVLQAGCRSCCLHRPPPVKQYLLDPLVQLRSSLLDPVGSFLLLNTLRRLPPGGRLLLLLAFSPTLGKRVGDFSPVLG